MKVIKGVQFRSMKGTYSLWLWPAVYISYSKYDAAKTLSIQFNWLNMTVVICFFSNAAYYKDPLLYSKKDYEEYLDKGEEEFLKEKGYSNER